MVYLIVDFYIQSQRVPEAEALFRQHVEDGRQDRGNRLFAMFRDPKDPTRFTSVEAWESRADVDHHDAQPHHPVFLQKLKEIETREKEVRWLDAFDVDLL